MANINTNYGFDKCGSFEEIAMLALKRSMDINDSGMAKVNIRVSRKNIDIHFYKGSTGFGIHYCHGTVIPGFHSLNEMDQAFKQFEEVGGEVCYA